MVLLRTREALDYAPIGVQQHQGNLMKISEAFDPRRNALNVWRLLLAAEVILWHSYLTTGRTPLIPHPVLQMSWSIGSMGFSRSRDS
jgi:hypothetical protein